MKSQFIRITLIVCLLVAAPTACLAQSLDLPESVLTSLEQGWSGSGAIVSSDGYIITNNHVVEGATTIEVVLASGQVYEATVIEAEPDLDLALIKIDAEDLPAIPIDADREMKQGYAVVSIGSPKGLVGTLSTGVITALNRDALELEGLYQTDANIAPGSSGGPLIDEYGNLIGVNVAVAQESGVSLTAFGFAIPIGQAEDLLGYVRNLPGRRSDVLTVPGIAEACSPATVYIVCEKDVPLLSLLPGVLDGYTEKARYEASAAELAELDTMLSEFPPVIVPKICNWRGVREVAVTFQNKPLESTVMFDGGAWLVYVAIISSENLNDALLLANAERRCVLSEYEVISQGTYTSGGLVANWESGWDDSLLILDHGTEPLEHETHSRLVSIATLPMDDFVLVVACTWFSPSPLCLGGVILFRLEDGCVVSKCGGLPWSAVPIGTPRQQLLCLTDFLQEAQWVFEEALAAVAEGL